MLKQRGLSVVELLVGAAVGLFLLGGAAKLFVDSVSDSRRLIVETRVNQDLRAAADLIARDLRRAGYWQNALSAAAPASAVANPYGAVAVTGAASSAQLTYSFSRDANDVVDANEAFGFRLAGNAVQTQVNNGSWQQVTDPTAVAVTQFAVTPVLRDVSLGHLCTPMCAVGSPGCPSMQVRSYDIVLVGRAATDNNVVREIRESVRLRNDVPPPACP
jgi:type IV pilus assembly protein PilW